MLGPLPSLGLCRTYGEAGAGPSSVIALAFQRLGVSPDGSAVVFEVTDDHSLFRVFFPSEGLVPPEREGFSGGGDNRRQN